MNKQFNLQKKYQECKQNISNYFLEYYFKEKISRIEKEGRFKIFNNPTLMDKWGEAVFQLWRYYPRSLGYQR